MQIGFCGRDQATEDVGFVLFSFFNVLWASVYVEAWKRYSAELAYRWGTLDQRDELLVEPRPLFTVSMNTTRLVTNNMKPLVDRVGIIYLLWYWHHPSIGCIA